MSRFKSSHASFAPNALLARAAESGSPDDLRLALDAGADLTARDAQGLDARDHARRRGHVQCADLIDSCIQQRELAASLDAPPAHRSPARRV